MIRVKARRDSLTPEERWAHTVREARSDARFGIGLLSVGLIFAAADLVARLIGYPGGVVINWIPGQREGGMPMYIFAVGFTVLGVGALMYVGTAFVRARSAHRKASP